MNHLELKHFNNIEQQLKKDSRLIENRGNQFQHEIQVGFNNFYEFYVDGTALISLLFTGGNHLNFLNNFNGALGVYGKHFDEIFIYSLLKKKIDRQTVLNIYAKHNKKIRPQHDELIKSIIDETNDYHPLIYRCLCGDYFCGGIEIKVDKHGDQYQWRTENEHGQKLVYNFEKEAYEKLFDNYLRNWKSAT